jgi:hypothetical protein
MNRKKVPRAPRVDITSIIKENVDVYYSTILWNRPNADVTCVKMMSSTFNLVVASFAFDTFSKCISDKYVENDKYILQVVSSNCRLEDPQYATCHEMNWKTRELNKLFTSEYVKKWKVYTWCKGFVSPLSVMYKIKGYRLVERKCYQLVGKYV